MSSTPINLTGNWTELYAAASIEAGNGMLIYCDGGNIAVALSDSGEPGNLDYDCEAQSGEQLIIDGEDERVATFLIYARATTGGSASIRCQSDANVSVRKQPWTDKRAYVPTRQAIKVLAENESLMGEAMVVQRRTVISLDASFGISKLRHRRQITGDAFADESNRGRIVLHSSATAGSSYRLSSGEVGQYAPGFAAEMGIGVLVDETFAGTAFAQWGGLSTDGENGLYFRKDATGIACVRRRDDVNVDEDYQGNWNLDNLDGTGPSKINVQTETGYIYQVDFTWYGYGLILFGVIRQMTDAPEIQHFIPCHYIQVDGGISISEPNLALFAEVDNGDQATDYEIDIGGMQYTVKGINDAARKRHVDEIIDNSTGIGTTRTHMMSFRREPGELNRSFELEAIELEASGERIIIEVYIGGTLTLGGKSWGVPTGFDSEEQSIQSVTLASYDETDATMIYRTSAGAGQGNKSGAEGSAIIDLNLPSDEMIHVTARVPASAGTGTGDVVWLQVSGREGW